MTEKIERRGGPRPLLREDDGRREPGFNKVFIPTDEMREQVKTLAKVCSIASVALRLGISVSTLTRHFRKELDSGREEVDEMFLSKIVRYGSEKGHPKEVECMTKWLKRPGGPWDSRKIEISGPGGGPVPTIDARELDGMTDEQLAAIRTAIELLAAGAAGADPE